MNPILHHNSVASYLLIVVTGLFLNGCVSHKSVQITRAPKPQIIAKDQKPKVMPARFLKLQLEKQLPELEELVIGDQHYIYITKEWFLEMHSWTEEFIKNQAPHLYTANAFPADYRETHIMFLSSMVNLQIARHYNLKSSALIGTLTAKSVAPWGAIPATGKDEIYTILLSDSSMMVFDVFTKQICDIYDFPNLKHTKAIFF